MVKCRTGAALPPRVRAALAVAASVLTLLIPASFAVDPAHADPGAIHDGLIVVGKGSPLMAFRSDDGTAHAAMFQPTPCAGDTRVVGYGTTAWSADGTWLALVQQCVAGEALQLRAADGSSARELVRRPIYGMTVRWDATGDALFVSGNGTTSKVGLDGTVTQLVSHDTVASADGHLAWWCDNQYDDNTQTNWNAVCVYDPLTTLTTEVTARVQTDAEASLAWSADSRQLAYHCGAYKLCLYDVTTRASRNIVDFSASGGYPDVSDPVWSPDGTKLLFQANDGTHIGAFETTMDGSAPRFLLSGYPETFSPTGSQVLFSNYNHVLGVAAADGSSPQWLTTGSLPSWQPCSKAVCDGPRALTAPCTITGTSGNDVLNGTPGDDVLCAGAGNDRINPGGGNDIIRAGTGTNTIDLRSAPRGVEVNLATQSVSGWGNDQMFGVENVLGSQFRDVLQGDDVRNVLNGNGGNDDLIGYGGDDTLLGGSGNDYLRGGAGDDDIVGGEGTDRVSFASSPKRVRVNLGTDSASGEGSDILVTVENVSGSRFDDFIVGSDGRNVINSGDGTDVVEAGGGNDVVYGGDQRDYLYGQGGNDHLYGQGGADYLNGGAGQDGCLSGTSVSC